MNFIYQNTYQKIFYKIFWGLIVLFFGMPALYAKVMFCLPQSTEKVVSLTFDDGPSAHHTPCILDILKKHHIKATFFMVGECAKRYPQVVRAVLAQGHEIGNHTYTHANLKRLSLEKIKKEIADTNEVLKSIGVKKISWFRPPYGSYTKEIAQLADSMGMDTVLWSVCSKDWRRPSLQVMLNNIEQTLKPGAVILFHDIHKNTANLLEKVIIFLSSKGYKFVLLSKG